MIKVYVFRHPQSQHNKDGIIRGEANSRLSKEGLHQAQEIAEALKDIPFTLFLTAPADICYRFTNEVYKYHRGKTVMHLQELRDRCLGVYEDQPYSNIGTIDDVFQMAIRKELRCSYKFYQFSGYN